MWCLSVPVLNCCRVAFGAQEDYIQNLAGDCKFTVSDGNCPYVAALILQLALAAFNAGLLYGLSMERWVVGIVSGLGSVVLCIIEVKKIYDASDILNGNFDQYTTYKAAHGAFFGATGADSIHVMSRKHQPALPPLALRLYLASSQSVTLCVSAEFWMLALGVNLTAALVGTSICARLKKNPELADQRMRDSILSGGEPCPKTCDRSKN